MMCWEIREQNKVLCAILSIEHVAMKWALGFRKLIIPGPDPVTVAGRPYDHARNECAQLCLERGCEWLFFLDSDVVPPPDAVLRLLSHNKPLISGMYCRRSPPHAVPVMMKNGQWVTDLPGPGQNSVIEVELVGAGCLLIHRTVLETVAKSGLSRPGKPWFDWTSDLHGILPVGEALSEDFSFNLKCRKLGIPVLVDTSIRCLHVGLAQADFGSFVPAA